MIHQKGAKTESVKQWVLYGNLMVSPNATLCLIRALFLGGGHCGGTLRFP